MILEILGIRIKDASNTILGNGYWPNGNLLTDNWYGGITVAADFQCANVTLQSGTTYVWEIYSVYPANPTFEVILFITRDNTSYPDGNYIKDGVQQTKDLIGWVVNLTTTVNAPNAPIASAQSFCGSKTVASLTATASSGNTLKWYAAATGGTVLANSTAITTTGTYYVSQSIATCESSRTSVVVTINTAPATPTTDNAMQTFTVASANLATIANLVASPNTIVWYANASNASTNTNPLASTTQLTSGTTYYAVSIANGCPSAALAVTATVTIETPVVIEKTFKIATGTKIVTSGAVTINYKGGTITNDGTITNSNGTLAFSNPVTYAGAGTASTKGLKVAHTGTSTLKNRIMVTSSLDITDGNLNANNNLTLVSNASGSAVITPVASGSAIAGKVTVQRYIAQGKRAFRFFTPSVTTDNFISNNWQLTTHITGSTTGTGGFDATGSGSPSLFTYNNQQASGSGWMPIASTNTTNLEVTKGYRLLVRGDRNVNLSATSLPNMNNPVTLSATGTVAVGTVVFDSASDTPINNTTNTITNGYSMVGNPYVNTVNWNTLTKSNLTDAYYTWDANMGTALQRGRYVVYSTTTGSNNMDSNVNQYIQPGQAFLVKNTTLGTAGSMTFTENDKLGTNITNTFFRENTSSSAHLDLQVFETDELAIGGFPIDAAVAVFDDQFTNALENGDVVKLSTGIENIAFVNSGRNLTIDARPLVAPTDVLPIQLQEFVASKSYTFRTHFTDFDTNATPFLHDNYLNQYTALVLDAPSVVTFTTTTDAASFGTSRFEIVFQNTALNNSVFDASVITLYPNPVSNGQFTIALPTHIQGNVTVKVINLLGQTVYETKTQAQKNIAITMSNNLPTAVYVVEIENEGRFLTKKITVK